MAKQITAFSIREDGHEVERMPGNAGSNAGKRWESTKNNASAGVRVTLHALYSDGSEALRGWSRKPL